jgi:hypothetical protein
MYSVSVSLNRELSDLRKSLSVLETRAIEFMPEGLLKTINKSDFFNAKNLYLDSERELDQSPVVIQTWIGTFLVCNEYNESYLLPQV